jgi:hypothetical protein
MSHQDIPISTPEQIRAAQRSEREAKASRVVAPSGAVYRLYKPTAGEWLAVTGVLTQSLAAKIAPANSAPLTTEEQVHIARQAMQLFSIVIVEPRFSLFPESDEVGPFDLPDTDREFIRKWASGQIAPDGSDLNSFCDPGRAAPVAR